MHVRDVASAFAALLLSPVEGSVNIASGCPVRLADIARRIAAKLDAEKLLKLGALPISAGDPPVLTASTGRLNREVNWTPSIPLEQGIDESVRWWRARTL